jgi:uncharacterized repeat protein (TIGR03847 family)
MLIELDPVDRITADAVGPPGQRTFYLQARKGDRVITLLVEKQQVQLLAASVVEILSRVGKETSEGPPEEEMGLAEPLLPEWRAGRISIGYHDERDLLMLECEELVDEELEGEAEGDEPPTGLDALGPELSIAGMEELEPGMEELEPDLNRPTVPEREPERVRFWATREQMLSLARHGARVCAAGRPRCELCGNPIDPEGHVCPALNGHRRRDEE